MALIREHGAVQPGLNWGPFTTRIPFVHVKVGAADVIQGALLSLATAGALAPLMVKYFAVPFEVAWSIMIIQMVLVWSHTFFFGDPYAPGWITPALPLTLVALGGITPGPEAVKMILALMIIVSALFFFFGLTGLGARFNKLVPDVIKAGIIMGGGIAAFNGELARLMTLPVTLSAAWITVLLLMFSIPFGKLKKTHKSFAFMASISMVMGLLVAGIVGFACGELKFDIKWGFYAPHFPELIQMCSPWGVGWPSFSTILNTVPLAIMVYIITFGEIIIAETLVKDANQKRPDEKIIINHNRTHYALGIRNIVQMLLTGAFIPLHGPSWTGMTVFLTERFKNSMRKEIDSLYSLTINYYWGALPFVFLTPVVTLMIPIMPVALSIALLLTGFACAYVSMSMVHNNVERGLALFIAMFTAFKGAAWGLGIGILAYLLLVGFKQTGFSTNSEVQTKSS